MNKRFISVKRIRLMVVEMPKAMAMGTPMNMSRKSIVSSDRIKVIEISI
jgi:hypothetical protein